MAKKKVLLHDDNAPIHSCRVSQQKLTQLLSHPAYSPDLAASDFHLFQKLTTFLVKQKFVCSEEAIQVANDYFESLEEKHLRKKIESLEKH